MDNQEKCIWQRLTEAHVYEKLHDMSRNMKTNGLHLLLGWFAGVGAAVCFTDVYWWVKLLPFVICAVILWIQWRDIKKIINHKDKFHQVMVDHLNEEIANLEGEE